MKRYRCKHAVEAMRWIDTDDMREQFADWFETHDECFMTRGDLVVLADGYAKPGEWILYSADEFIVMDDLQFTFEYAEVES